MRTEKRPPISGGSLFSRSIQVFFGTLPQFFFLALLILSPLTVFDYQDFKQPTDEVDPTRALLGFLAQTVLSNILTGALVFGVFQRLAGRRVALGECIAQALRRLLLIVLVSFLFGLMFGVGLVLLVIPGLFVMAVFSLGVPVAVVEGGSPVGALQRSMELTRGHRWDVFVALILVGLTAGVVLAAGGMLLAALNLNDAVLMAVGLLVFKAMIGVLSAVAPTVIYHDLRAAKDGFSVEDLSEVFE